MSSVLTGALASLVRKLARLASDEYKLHKDVKKEVEELQKELDIIHTGLNKISYEPWYELDEGEKLWAKELREASYDMEDVLDDFLVGRHKKEPNRPKLKQAINNMVQCLSKYKDRHDIACAVKDIKERLAEVAERHQRYRVADKNNSMSKPDTTGSDFDPAIHKDVTQLIGVDKSRDEVISMLNPSQSDDDAPGKKIIKSISIVGVGGLGKTTLAKAVYEKLKSMYRYDCAAFVSVGRHPDLAKVFKDILFQLNKHEYKDIHNTGRDANLLATEIQKFLQEKRYFVVVDDVWYAKTWSKIKLALVDDKLGSKIITTTRMFDVAEKAGEVYKLERLSNDDSKAIFNSILSREDRRYHGYQQNEVSDKILSKCGGIPLAIITMASLLHRKLESEWSKIYDSIGFSSIDDREVEDTMKILSYSYYDLLPNLKTCLLYISKYPEDYLIEKDSLIWKWISEGFIVGNQDGNKNGNQETSLFELGETYFRDLVNSSLIQKVERMDGRVLGCHVHDMVLDLLRKISSDQDFIALLVDNVEGQSTSTSVRRLAHQYRIVEDIDSKAKNTKGPKLSSYTAIMCYIKKSWLFPLRFKYLRVLDIVHCSFEEGCHLKNFGDLRHLRYLGIRCGDSVILKQIGNLKLLQALDVDTTTLPASIVQLTGLVRLCAEQADAPDWIGALTSLEELIIGRGTERFLKELGSLKKMRVLRFSIDRMSNSMQIDFVMSLCNLKNIQHIHVFGYSQQEHTALYVQTDNKLPTTLHFLDLSIPFSNFPPWIRPFRYLSYLTLRVNTMAERDLIFLGLLPELCYLWLKTSSRAVTASNINNANYVKFRKLRYFRINAMVQFGRTDETDASVSLHLWSGKGDMPFSSGKSNNSCKVVPCDVMPNLEVLEFYVPLEALKDKQGDCGNIGLEYLPSLREVTGWIDHDGMDATEGEAMLAALRNACEVHPNNPTLYMLPKNMRKEEGDKQQQEAEVASQRAHIGLSKLSLSSS